MAVHNWNYRGSLAVLAWAGCVLTGCSPQPAATGPRGPFVENFDQGPGGWYRDRHYALPVFDGAAYSYSPWWTDANHAPPGAGYLHLIMWMYTDKRRYQGDDEYLRKLPYRGTKFAEEGFSRDLRNARLGVRIRGDIELKGSQLVLHVQAQTSKTTANFALTGQPFKVTRDWTEQTVTLTTDASQWTCLGARHDMTGEYGCDDIATVLADVNLDIIFLLFPVKAVPAAGPVADPHKLRAGKDYAVDQWALPSGIIMFDWVRIDYPGL